MKWIDRFFILMQTAAASFQLIGSFMYTELWSNLFAWSLSGALIPALLIALNLLRNARGPNDRALAAIALAGNLAWGLFILMFGHTQGNMLDIRIVLHATAAFALAVFSLLPLITSPASALASVGSAGSTSQPAR